MAQLVAKMQAPTISVGFDEENDSLIPIIVAGIKVMQEVLRAMKVHMASDASCWTPRLSCCNSCMAFIPKGVAALPKPNILALRFRIIAPMAGWSEGTLGNNLRRNGFNI